MNSVRLYRRLLRLYPRPFYERFGAEMEMVFTQARDDASSQQRFRVFLLREFGGLMISIANAHWQARKGVVRRTVFNWRLIPVWLFVFSLIAAAVFSLNYWGYLVVPPSIFRTLQSVESIVLVEFDADYRPTRIPINQLPASVIPDFPPSQILPLIEERAPETDISPSLDPALAEMLAAALAAEGIELAAPAYEYPTEPTRPDTCTGCFILGVQRQPDGTLLEIFPVPDQDGNFTGETYTYHLTPEDWYYYRYFAPSGYVVEGRGADGSPLVFTAIASGAVANDHYRYYEFVFSYEGNRLIPQQRQNYAFDIAGIEGMTFPVLTAVCFVPLLLLYLVLVIVGVVLAFIIKRTAQWRSPRRA